MAKKTDAKLDPLNLPKAKLSEGAIPSMVYWKDEEGVEHEASIHDVVMAHDPDVHGPWRGDGGKGKHNGGYYNSDAVRDCIGRKLVVNETGLLLAAAGKVADTVSSMIAHAIAWQDVSARWATDKGYGNQHFTAQGPMNASGVNRLSSEGIAKNAACFMEILCQRAAMVDEVTDPATKEACEAAAQLLRGLSGYSASRVAQVKDQRKQRYYAIVKADGEKSLKKANA